jgi:hypothetical protein
LNNNERLNLSDLTSLAIPGHDTPALMPFKNKDSVANFLILKI